MILRGQPSSKDGLGRSPTARIGAPVSFTASAPTLAAGSSVVLDAQALQAGYRTAYWIDEIRMQVYTASEAAASIDGVDHATRFLFRTGAWAFSPVPVPMGLFAPVFLVNNSLASFYSGTNIRVGRDIRWHLPKPLWMAPGDVIQCEVFRSGAVATDGDVNFSADVTYVGRAEAPCIKPPKTRDVPYVNWFRHAYATAFSQVTTEFRNPMTQPLVVQRFLARTGIADADTGGYRDPSRAGNANHMLPDSLNLKYPEILMSDSLGYQIVPRWSAVGNVFDAERCAWTFSRPLGPREQFDVQLRTSGADDPDGSEDWVFDMAMMSYRSEGWL